MKRSVVFVVFALVLAGCSSSTGSSSGSGGRGPAIGMDVRRSTQTAATASESEAHTGEAGPLGPAAVVVPDVTGLRFAPAVHQLWRHGIDFHLVFARDADAPLWSVIEEDPRAGGQTPASGKVNLVLSLHHMHGAGVIGTVRCKPEADELADPYCLGKLLKYSGGA